MVKDSSITIFLVLNSPSSASSGTVKHKTGHEGQIALNLKIYFFALSEKRVDHE